MSPSATTLRRSYSMHGVGIEVSTADAAVIEAMDLRLRDFRDVDDAAGRLDGIVLEFVSSSGGRRTAPETPADDELSAAGVRPVYDTPFGSLCYSDADDLFSGALAGVHLRCDAARGHAVFSADEFRGRALYLATHPLATVALMELMERRERFSLHAACLAGEDGGGLVLSGPSGAGKSTLTIGLARAGMGFLSDDVVFLAARDGSPVRALGFADTVGLSEFALQRFPELRSRLDSASDGFPKRLCRIEDLFGRPAVGACEPRVIVFPEVAADGPSDGLSELAPLDPWEAFLRLVPDVMLTHPGATQAHLSAIRALIEQARCYTLRTGRDLEHAAGLLSRLV